MRVAALYGCSCQRVMDAVQTDALCSLTAELNNRTDRRNVRPSRLSGTVWARRFDGRWRQTEKYQVSMKSVDRRQAAPCPWEKLQQRVDIVKSPWMFSFTYAQTSAMVTRMRTTGSQTNTEEEKKRGRRGGRTTKSCSCSFDTDTTALGTGPERGPNRTESF